jgi:hypothetical protein
MQTQATHRLYTISYDGKAKRQICDGTMDDLKATAEAMKFVGSWRNFAPMTGNSGIASGSLNDGLDRGGRSPFAFIAAI